MKNEQIMDIKETIVSSIYFHLILFFLMLAVSQYTAGISGDMQKIISVDLAMKDSNDQPAVRSELSENPPIDSPTRFKDEIALPESVQSKPDEAPEIPEIKKQEESPAELAKPEKAEYPPLQKEGFSSMEAYYQFIMLHKKLYAQQTGSRVNQALGQAFKINKREFFGGSAIVTLMFGSDRNLAQVSVESSSQTLKDFLEEIGWGFIPPPSVYSLGYNTVQIEFIVLEGYMSFNIKTL